MHLFALSMFTILIMSTGTFLKRHLKLSYIALFIYLFHIFIMFITLLIVLFCENILILLGVSLILILTLIQIFTVGCLMNKFDNKLILYIFKIIDLRCDTRCINDFEKLLVGQTLIAYIAKIIILSFIPKSIILDCRSGNILSRMK